MHVTECELCSRHSMERSGIYETFWYVFSLSVLSGTGHHTEGRHQLHLFSSFSAPVRKFSTRCTWLMAYLFSVASWHIFWCVYKHWFITGKNGHLASCQIDHYCLHLKIESSYVASSLFHIISLSFSLSLVKYWAMTEACSYFCSKGGHSQCLWCY